MSFFIVVGFLLAFAAGVVIGAAWQSRGEVNDPQA